MGVKKVYYSWEDYEDSINGLVKLITDPDSIDYVVGIPRGGLIVAVHLSHLLGFKHMTIDHFERVEKKLTKERVLIVDDISDSGQTIKKYVEAGYQTATLDVRFSTVAVPKYFANFHNHTDWIVYPWEDKDSKTIQDYLD